MHEVNAFTSPKKRFTLYMRLRNEKFWGIDITIGFSYELLQGEAAPAEGRGRDAVVRKANNPDVLELRRPAAPTLTLSLWKRKTRSGARTVLKG